MDSESTYQPMSIQTHHHQILHYKCSHMIGWYQSRMHFHYIHGCLNHIHWLVDNTRSLHRPLGHLHSDTCGHNQILHRQLTDGNYEFHLNNDLLKSFPIQDKRNQIFQIHFRQDQMTDFVDEYLIQYFHSAYANFNPHLWNPALKVNPDNQNMTIGDYFLGANQLKWRNIDQ